MLFVTNELSTINTNTCFCLTVQLVCIICLLSFGSSDVDIRLGSYYRLTTADDVTDPLL